MAHDKYLLAGCSLAEEMEPEYFLGLYTMAKGNICNGCFHNNPNMRTSCEAKKKLFSRPNTVVIRTPVKTNAELAKELGVTKRQVAKMRKAGKL